MREYIPDAYREKKIEKLWTSLFPRLCAVSFPISIAASNFSIICVGFTLWIYKSIKTKRILFLYDELILPVILFILAGVVSCLFSYDPVSTLKHMKSAWLFLIYFAIINLMHKKDVKTTLYILLITTAFVAIVSIVEHFTYIRIFGYTIVKHFPRSQGFFNISLTYAGQLMQILLLLISFFFIYRKKRLAVGSIIILSIIAFLFTLSRGPWLGFLFGLLVFFIFYNKRLIPAYVAFLLLLVFFSYLFLPSVFERGRTLLAGTADSSIKQHLYLWKTALLMFSHHPLFGVGAGNFKHYALPLTKDLSFLQCHSSAHNIFLHTLATRGIIGFFAFVFLWYSILKSLLKRMHSPKDNLDYALNVGVFSAFCALLFAGLFETNFNDSEVIMMSWLLLGISRVSNT